MIHLLVAVAMLAQSPAADRILGTWNTPAGESKIEMSRCAEAYCGKIVAMLKPGALDEHNADSSRRSRSLFGLQILKGFRFDSPNTWAGGTLYAPERGRDFTPKLVLTGTDTLEVRVAVGVVRKTVVWTRIK